MNEQGVVIKAATEIDPYAFDIVYDYYLEPQLHEPIMLFLNYDDLFDLYFASGAPNVIAIKSDGSIELKSNLIKTQSQSKVAEQDQIFHSEGGKPIYYRSSASSDVVEDYLGEGTLKEILQKMGTFDNQQIEEILAFLSIKN